MIVIVLPDLATEDQLLARARRGDQAAIMQIYETYFSPVYQYIRLRVDERMVAEDLASDVFVNLINALRGSKAPHHSLRGWLFQVARHAIYDHFGETKKIPTVTLDETLDDWLSAPAAEQPEAQFVQSVNAEQMRQALRILPAEQQEVVVLRFGQTLSLQETADIMGKTVSAIKSLQFRAVDALKRILTETRA